MKYIAPKAELVLLETESIMAGVLWSSGDMLPDDDASAAPVEQGVEWDG